MRKINRENQLIFTKDGEFLKALKDGDVVLSKEQLENSDRYKALLQEINLKEMRSKQERGTDFVKHMISEDFKGLITGNNSGHALECAVRISFKKGPKGGYLIMNDILGLQPATFGDMRHIFGVHNGKEMSKSSTTELVKKLEEADFLWVTRNDNSKREKGKQYKGEIEENIYEINPKFFVKGSTKNAHYVKFYLKKFKDFTKGLQPSDKGFLLEISPYFHFDQYCLCLNPHEPNFDNVIPLDRQGLADRLGLSYNHVKTKISKLNKAGILGEFISNGQKELFLHPDLVFKKDVQYEDIDYTDKIRRQFESTKKKAQQKDEKKGNLSKKQLDEINKKMEMFQLFETFIENYQEKKDE